jgi:hypothetical protein
MVKTEKPVVVLSDGVDGNAFGVMGACRKAARKAGWDDKRINDFLAECKKGSYDDLLQTCYRHFEVE